MAQRIAIGQLLVERGVVDHATVERAAAEAPAANSRLCSHLLATGKVGEGDLAAALGELLGLPGVDLSRTVCDLAATDLVPRVVAEDDLLLPMSLAGDRVHLAVDSPQRAAQAIDEVRFVSGREVSVYVAVLSALRAAIAACYDARARGAARWRGAAATAEDVHVAERPPLPRAASRAQAPLPLPRAPVPPAPPRARGGGVEVVHAVTVAARRALVVDDEAAIRLLAQRALQHRGFEVATAVDGADALEQLQRQPFDVVLLDAMLPQVHGFEVARRIRSDPRTRALPVVIMSALYRGWRFAQDAKESYGAQDYIEKPFRIDDLVRRVEAVLAGAGPAPAGPDASAHVARGRAALDEGRVEDALGAFDEAVRADPFSAAAHHGLGEALRRQGDGFRAMTELERAVELEPGLMDALRMLAALYVQKGFRAKAAETVERAVAASPDARTREQLRRELLRLI